VAYHWVISSLSVAYPRYRMEQKGTIQYKNGLAAGRYATAEKHQRDCLITINYLASKFWVKA